MDLLTCLPIAYAYSYFLHFDPSFELDFLLFCWTIKWFPFRVQAKAKPPTIFCKSWRDLELRLQSFKRIRLGHRNSRKAWAFSQSLVSQCSRIQALNKAEEAGYLKPEALRWRCHFMYNRIQSTNCFNNY